MKRKWILILALTVVALLATTVTAMAADYFDTTDLGKGIIRVTYDGGGKMKVMIEKGDKKYTYDQNSSGVKESYPLQLGNGTYKVSLLKNTSGNAYQLVASKTVDVKLSEENAVYLASIQTVNWNVDSKAVAKAIELTKDTPDLQKKASILWDYMVKNNAYDYKKLETLATGYIPVVDKTFVDKSGICYDFSALYAAMLRSQGTPAKLVKGYAPKNAVGYHAWNEVYDAVKKQWIVVDSTYDLQVIKQNANVTMVKNSADFSKVYEY